MNKQSFSVTPHLKSIDFIQFKASLVSNWYFNLSQLLNVKLKTTTFNSIRILKKDFFTFFFLSIFGLKVIRAKSLTTSITFCILYTNLISRRVILMKFYSTSLRLYKTLISISQIRLKICVNKIRKKEKKKKIKQFHTLWHFFKMWVYKMQQFSVSNKNKKTKKKMRISTFICQVTF